MEWEKDLLEFLKLNWKIVSVVIAAFIIFAVFPVFFIHRAKEWQNFAAWATWFYTVITLFTLMAIFGAAYFAYVQMRAMQEQLRQSAATNYQVSRQSAWNGIFSMTNLINNYIATHKDNITIPPYPEILSGQDTLVLLFHHIDLIYLYYINRGFITPEECKGMERWVDKVFFRWIGCDHKIFNDFKTILEFGDYYSDDFIDWLKSRDTANILEARQ